MLTHESAVRGRRAFDSRQGRLKKTAADAWTSAARSTRGDCRKPEGLVGLAARRECARVDRAAAKLARKRPLTRDVRCNRTAQSRPKTAARGLNTSAEVSLSEHVSPGAILPRTVFLQKGELAGLFLLPLKLHHRASVVVLCDCP